jgi:hypothetical protein
VGLHLDSAQKGEVTLAQTTLVDCTPRPGQNGARCSTLW